MLGARVLALASPPPTGTAAAPSGALHTSGALSLTCGRGVVLKLVPAPLSLTVARCRRCVAPPDCVCCAFLHAGSLISHVIPLRLFQDLNCDRWYFNVSACCCGVGPIELRAIFLGVGLRLRVGVAYPSRETGVACACACLRGIETGVAFARSYVPGVETGVAFAGENRLVLACFSVAVVLSVSTVAVQGRAVVTAVSYWPASAVAEASMVSKSPRRRVWCVKKFAQHGQIVGVSVKKFALRARNTPNLTFLRLLGEFCRENTDGAVALGEFCRGLSGGEGVLGEFCRACRPATATGPGSATGPVPAAILCGASVPPHRRRWGFCSIRSWLAGYLRRVAALMLQFPPIWW